MSDISRNIHFNRQAVQTVKEGNELDPDVLFTLPSEWVQLYKKWKTVELTCARCGTIYNDITNIGSWGCKQHAGEYNTTEPGKYRGQWQWDCCGERERESNGKFAHGCVKCDHRPIPVNYYWFNNAILPIELVANIVNMKREAIIENYELVEFQALAMTTFGEGYSIIRRYDRTEDDARKQKGESSEEFESIGGMWRKKGQTGWYRTRS